MDINTESKIKWRKHAILIMAHNQFELLDKLMRMLDHECFDIYIHIDKKARGFRQSEFEEIFKKSKVVFIPRMNVYWGMPVWLNAS